MFPRLKEKCIEDDLVIDQGNRSLDGAIVVLIKI